MSAQPLWQRFTAIVALPGLGLSATLAITSNARAQIVVERQQASITMNDRPIDHGLPGFADQDAFFGVELGGDLVAQTFADPTSGFIFDGGVFFDEEIEFVISADPGTRMGFEFFAGVDGGTLSSHFLSEFESVFAKRVRPGQQTQVRIDNVADNSSGNTLLQAKSPTISAGANFVLEGGFDASIKVVDFDSNVVEINGLPLSADFRLDLPGTSPVFTVSPGETSVDVASLGPTDFGLQVPASITTLGDNDTFVNLPLPQGFKINGTGEQEPFASLKVDTDKVLVDALLARGGIPSSAGVPGLAEVSIDGAGFSASLDTAELDLNDFLDVKAQASVTLIDLPLNFGAALRHEYELTVDDFDLSNFRVVDHDGNVVVTAPTRQGTDPTSLETFYDWTVPSTAAVGDVLTVLVDVDYNGELLAVTELFGPATEGLEVLAAELKITILGEEFTLFDESFGSATDDFVKFGDIELGRALNDLDGLWDTATLSYDVIVVPEPATVTAFALGALAIVVRARPSRD